MKKSFIKLTCCGMILFFSQCAKDKQTVLSADDLVKITVPVDNVPADGVSLATIKVTVDPASVALQNDVVFTASTGSFANGSGSFSTTLSLDGTATAYLKNTVVQDVTVTATVHALYTNQQTVHFKTSYPDKLTIDMADSYKNQDGLKIPITGHVTKQQGTFLSGVIVAFNATNSSGKIIGSFNNIRSADAGGAVSADFYLGDPAYKGNVFVKGYFVRAAGDTVKASNQALIN